MIQSMAVLGIMVSSGPLTFFSLKVPKPPDAWNLISACTGRGAPSPPSSSTTPSPRHLLGSPAMTAELPGLLPFRWEANDGPITPRRPEDGVEFGAVGAVAAGTRAGERVARSGRGHPYVSANWNTQSYFATRRLGSRS